MNKKVGDIVPFFKSQKFQKIASGVLIVLILVALPLTLYEVKQQQTVNQNAAFLKGQQHYACGEITVYLTPDSKDACSTGTNKQLTSYQTNIFISATGTNKDKYTVHWKWAQFWCNSDATTGSCLDNETQTSEQTANLGGDPIPAQSADRSPIAPFTGQACGAYQYDFGFYVTDNSGKWICGLSTMKDLGNTNNNASFCHTTNKCSPPTTPTNTPTDSPTPGVTITPTDSPTPDITITPTDTVTPTDTPTPPITGVTDTPTPTNQPSDTPTTIIVTTTPKPTLPPTGPSNTLVNIGIIGGIVAVAGVALILIL